MFEGEDEPAWVAASQVVSRRLLPRPPPRGWGCHQTHRADGLLSMAAAPRLVTDANLPSTCSGNGQLMQLMALVALLAEQALYRFHDVVVQVTHPSHIVSGGSTLRLLLPPS